MLAGDVTLGAGMVAVIAPRIPSGGRSANADFHREGKIMSRFIIALFLLLAAQQASAAECGSTANRAGCVGPNGAATYNKNTGQAHTAQSSQSNQVAPGTSVQGRRGNTATKGLEQGCGFVNGKRVCN
jgi:hypothetical protein